MIPVNGPVYGALFAAASRAASGEVDLSEEQRERLREGRESLDELSDMVGDFSPTKPGSWGRFAGRMIDRMLGEQRLYDSRRDAVDARGWDEFRVVPKPVEQQVRRVTEGTLLLRDDELELRSILLANGVEIGIESNSQGGRVHWHGDELDCDELDDLLSRLVWTDCSAMFVDWDNGSSTMETRDLSDYRYHGERLELIDWIESFRREGIRRNVLLQGPPGTGKTTLCCHAARELSDRVVHVTGEVVNKMNLVGWRSLLRVLGPEVLVVDDIDRSGGIRDGNLGRKLQFFEEGYCDVPVVLFTSNDHTRIPAAMRRPGRIDRVVEFDEPDDQMRREIIRDLGAEEDVEVPDDQMDRLLGLLDRYSPAHVLEAIRRARVRGWDESGTRDGEFRFQRHFDGPRDWMRVHGYQRFEARPEFVFDEVESLAEPEIAYEDERSRLLRSELPNGSRLLVEETIGGSGHNNWYFRPEGDGRNGMREGIAQLFWADRSAAMLDAVENSDIRCQSTSLDGHHYYGPLVDRIDDWKRFAELGMRRNVLLQGPPGCGKSTFCMHAARELSDRTLVLTPDFYDQIRCGDWRKVVELLSPRMVIVDDVDRVSSRSLESKLRLFEEGYCEVPYVLMTSNNVDELPEPMRRPGRLDQIIEVDPPDRELRWRLIDEMADREGLDEVPDEHLERLDELLCDASVAHLVEALRRAKVLGWDDSEQLFVGLETEGDETSDPPDESLAL